MWKSPGVTEQGLTEMKERKVKRSPLDIVDRCIDLQYQLDEHRRFLGDLLIMLAHPEKDHISVDHDVDMADFIWEKTQKMINDNRRMSEMLAQFSQGSEKTVN